VTQFEYKKSYPTETVYLLKQNYFSLQLTEQMTAVTTSGFTTMKMAIGDVLVESTNIAGDPIRWSQSGYEDGEVRFQLGEETDLVAGRYPRCYLVVYDATYTSGRVWGAMQLFLLDDVEEVEE
jgi:hypothetical protein